MNEELIAKRKELLDKHSNNSWIFLTDDQKDDVLRGRCRYSEYQNVPILDYSLRHASS